MQRVLQIDGFMKVYWILNFSESKSKLLNFPKFANRPTKDGIGSDLPSDWRQQGAGQVLVRQAQQEDFHK